MSTLQVPAVRCDGLWKVFGDAKRGNSVIDLIRKGEIDGDEAREKHGCVVAVQDATFDVNPGEVFCIMGLSGSGKSTLIRHVNGLVEPTTGDVFIEGQNLSSLSREALRNLRASQVGMVFQNVALLPHRTVGENTRLPLELRGLPSASSREPVDRALSVVGLSGWQDRYPRELSGGMQQRVGLARALAADVGILLMDEPFSALDPLIRKQLQDEFRRLVKTLRKTALFITHDLEEAVRIGDRIAIMRHGKIVQIGTAEEIILAPEDDYVAQFVEGISRTPFIKADRIMVRPDRYLASRGFSEIPRNWPAASPGDGLDTLIQLQLSSENPIVILEKGAIVGVVGAAEMLAAVGRKTAKDKVA